VGPPVVRFVVLYVAGLWIAFLVAPSPAASIAIALATLLVGGRRWGWRHRLLCAFLAGWTLGSVAQSRRSASCAERWSPGKYAAYVRVHDAPGSRRSATATVLHSADGCGGRIRLRFDTGSSLTSGATIVVVGTVHTKGWMRVRHIRQLPRLHIPLRFRVRDRLTRRIHQLYGARAPLVDALVLGRRENLDPDLRTLFTSAGLAHLLAISGLHVGIVAAWVRLALAMVVGRRASWPISALATWAYVALLGFPPPATRAAAFVAIYAAGRMRQRRPPSSAVLAVGGPRRGIAGGSDVRARGRALRWSVAVGGGRLGHGFGPHPDRKEAVGSDTTRNDSLTRRAALGAFGSSQVTYLLDLVIVVPARRAAIPVCGHDASYQSV